MEKFINATEAGLKSSGSSKSHIGSYRTNTKPFIEFLADYENPPITTTQDLEANWRAVTEYREDLIDECNEKELSKSMAQRTMRHAPVILQISFQTKVSLNVPQEASKRILSEIRMIERHHGQTWSIRNNLNDLVDQSLPKLWRPSQ